MATKATSGALSWAERDMSRYATAKAHKLMQDVVQFADVAGITKQKAASCMGSTFLRLAATIAVQQKAPRDAWIRMATDVFDQCQLIDNVS